MTQQIPLTYQGYAHFDHISGTSESDTVYLLLHGYMQSSKQILKLLEGSLPAGKEIFALAAPYPVPYKKK